MRLEVLFNAVEGFSVKLTDAKLPNGLPVLPGPITFVLAEVILREPGVDLIHHPIPGHFCYDRGGSNGVAQSVSLRDRLLWNGEFQALIAIN